MSVAPNYLTRPDGSKLAYHRTSQNSTPDDSAVHHRTGADSRKPTGVVFLGGFMSDMGGTKAIALQDWAQKAGRDFLRFDYFGHGQSDGPFTDGCISRWADDAIAMIDEMTDGPQLLVGSSMGGWVMTLAALARPERMAGLVGIAPAPDFTEKLMWPNFSDEIKKQILEDGKYEQPSEYDPEPYTITKKLIEDGRENLLLDAPIPLHMPIRVLQGQEDPDVPWTHALKYVEMLESKDVEITLVKHGDHRLSEPGNLALLIRTVEALLAEIEQ
ncbi:MAG: alpha/beta hydrolase [Alphaproteobacteria bacterium]